MKRYVLTIVVCVLAGVFLTSCANSNTEELEKSIKDLQVELQSVKDENDSLLQELENTKKEKDTLSLELKLLKEKQIEEEIEKNIQNDDVEVKVIDIEKIPEDTNNWRFNSRVEFSIDIQNNTNKEIKGIQGVLDIQDMFGISIMKLNCDLTDNNIKPGEKVNNSTLGFDINEFMNNHVKVYTTDFENLVFVYTPSKIMFTDGSVKE